MTAPVLNAACPSAMRHRQGQGPGRPRPIAVGGSGDGAAVRDDGNGSTEGVPMSQFIEDRVISRSDGDPGLGAPIYASTITGRHLERGARTCRPVVSVLVSFTPVRHRSPVVA
jgi:hypothetical protein